MSEMHLKVEDMSCGHCVGAIQGALKSVPGVSSVEASLENKTVTVRSEGEMNADAVMTAIRGAGYTPELQG